MKRQQRLNENLLASWATTDEGGTGARENIIQFIADVEAAEVPAEDRIAVFDNDGTLWGEQPDYVQAVFAKERATTPENVKNESMESYRQAVTDWLASTPHRDGMLYTEMTYQPMLELLEYLRANGFRTFIVSGGGMEFVRPISKDLYGIPPEQVTGSNAMTAYDETNRRIVRMPERILDKDPEDPADDRAYRDTLFIDDKVGKPVGINLHIGRRPIAAFGNSSGDEAMLDWTTRDDGEGDYPRFGLLLKHNDIVREYDYQNSTAEKPINPGVGVLQPETELHAAQEGWTVVEMAADWKGDSVYATSGP